MNWRQTLQIIVSALRNPLGRLRCLQRADEETDGALRIASARNDLAMSELRATLDEALSPVARTAREAMRRVHGARGEQDA